MTKIYAVVRSDDEDSSLVALFSSEELANQFEELDYTLSIVECELDKFERHAREKLNRYKVFMFWDGSVASMRDASISSNEADNIFELSPHPYSSVSLRALVYAKDKEDATAIVDAKRLELIVNGEWDKAVAVHREAMEHRKMIDDFNRTRMASYTMPR